jgi:hypothetical protein
VARLNAGGTETKPMSYQQFPLFACSVFLANLPAVAANLTGYLPAM